ncbi:MAG: 30S ribosomal protein S27e [Halobacteriaceae archaeon]
MPGNFVRVKCPDCDNEQIVFGKTALEVACTVCGHTLAVPTGGRATINGDILEVVEER